MNIKNVTKEEMFEILSNSKSLREVILKFNLSANGSGGYRNIKSKILSLGLEIPKYEFRGSGGNNRVKLDDEIYVTNSSYPRSSLKKRIIRDKLIIYQCQICGNNGSHNSKPLSLHLDHINGLNNDNRLENLRFLCPNCHSQTDTYGGKTNKKTKIKKNRPRKVVRPEKNVLLQEVRTMGYMGTGRKYGVSDNAIRKWLKNYTEQAKAANETPNL